MAQRRLFAGHFRLASGLFPDWVPGARVGEDLALVMKSESVGRKNSTGSLAGVTE